MRIDAHVHGDFSKLKAAPAEYVASCRALGIERIGLIEDPDDVMAAHEAMPDFVIPIARVDIDAVTLSELREYLDGGAAAIKFINPRFSYGDTPCGRRRSTA
jgi:histidinol phosphatase-like PHP family hydrolase